jgi:hypothetical protein
MPGRGERGSIAVFENAVLDGLPSRIWTAVFFAADGADQEDVGYAAVGIHPKLWF